MLDVDSVGSVLLVGLIIRICMINRHPKVSAYADQSNNCFTCLLVAGKKKTRIDLILVPIYFKSLKHFGLGGKIVDLYSVQHIEIPFIILFVSHIL